MADLTTGAAEAMLDWFFTTGSPTRPTAWWAALFTVIPDADVGTGGTEQDETGYDRQSIGTMTRTSQTMNPGAVITFGPATEQWVESVAFGIYSLITSGAIYAFETLTTPRTLGNGDSAEFATADFSVTLT